MVTKAKCFVLPVLLVVLGFMLGLAFVRWRHAAFMRMPPPERRDEMFIRQFARDTGINEQQKQRVREILVEQRSNLLQLRSEFAPRFGAIRDKTRQEIRAILDPEQQRRFDEIEKRVAEEQQRFGPGPGGPPPFPPVDPPENGPGGPP